MHRKPASVLLGLLLITNFVLVSPPPTLAQIGGTGSIQGVITDPNGAVIHGATVIATNRATGIQTTRETTSAGFYLLTPLPPGEYGVSVSATGFQTLEQEKVIVDALTTVSLNLSLQVGGTSEAVKIVAMPAQLNASDARLGTTIRNELYTALP